MKRSIQVVEALMLRKPQQYLAGNLRDTSVLIAAYLRMIFVEYGRTP